jgi:formylglycine-generating enzyme required for sulfatase activity/serine/threonine protein kinase
VADKAGGERPSDKPASDPKKDPFGWVGHTIDTKYAVEEVVGEGGFGVVYKARHKGFAETVAIKCLKVPKGLKRDEREAFLETFLAEGRLLHQVSRATSDVVQALDVGDATSPNAIWSPYIVMEWLDGIPLSRDLRERARTGGKGGRAFLEALALLEPAARALAAAHEQGVAHRDVKPSNLFLAEVAGRATLKVVDFGIAKVLTDSQSAALATTASNDDVLGAFTPRYAAPEQFSRRYGATGPWTDVFALALVLVEVVTNKSALEGDDAPQFYISASDMLHRPTLRAKGIETSDEVEQVLLRALAVDPKRRYASVGEFWDALMATVPEAYARPKSIRPQSNVSLTPLASEEPRGPEIDPSTMNGSTTSFRRKQVTRVGLGVALALASIGACAFLWLGARTEPAHPPATAATIPHPPASGAPKPAPEPIAPPLIAPPGMVAVPAASFVMGSDKDSAAEKPAHPVKITRSFFIDRTEVTAKDYATCVRGKSCTLNRVHTSDKETGPQANSVCNTGFDPATERHPVNCIDQEQATQYCKSAGKRLPTEAEWELAARGTDGRTYPWGSNPPTTCWMAIVTGASGSCARKGTWEVGTTADGKSPYGAFDMAGNVWEWVADGWEVYPTSEVTDPQVPLNAARGILRGGSWDYSAGAAKSTSRLALGRSWAHLSTGFRCAMTAPTKKERDIQPAPQ